MRVSIKKHNRLYLEQLAAQMECDCGEALNYLLVELRRVNYSFGAQVNLGIHTYQIVEPLQPTEPGQLPMFGLSYVAENEPEVTAYDPVIERFVPFLEEF